MKVSCGERRSFWMMGILCFWVLILFRIAHATTDQSDVQAIQVLYSSLNNPSQLTGWKQNGGDPCGESWKGVFCSGSSVTAIRIPGLGLTGSMGYMLSSLTSLKELDLSNNKIQLSIPYQLPPNVTYLKLGGNNLTGNLPYSISTLVSLNYLNISHNSLSEPIGDLFAKLTDIDAMDLSYNNLSGNLPNSFSSFSNLSSLYLQNNLLTGNVTVLANLPQLDNLNIANNRFSGWLPSQFSSISNLDISGNSFNVGPAPPPPPFVPPPTSRPRRKHNTTGAPNTSPNEPRVYTAGAKKLAVGTIVGIVMGSLFFLLGGAFLIICCLKGAPKKKEKRDVTVSNLEVSSAVSANKAMQEQPKVDPHVTSLKPPPENVTGARPFGKDAFSKKAKSPITAASYTIASLQVATNSFSQDYLIGEGSLGRVYRAEYPNGKVLAVKKIDSSALALQEEDDFLEAVSHMSRLRHPNIAQLLGYCAEHGQHLLVYDFFGNGNLHDMLHFTEDDMSYFTEDGTKILAWNSRVRVALGTARALEYLHEVCLPPVVHRNFKSANILLDDDLNPHLSDCGLASLAPNTERQVSTHMLDSFGYSAPEFAMSGTYTAKSDVYSFGVVMLELLTGRKPLDSSRPRSEQSLVRWAIPQLHDIDALAKMVDPSLKGMYPVKSLSRFADIIALCVQPEPEFRPPMSEVVQALVRLVQRATVNTRRSSDEAAISYKISEHDPSDLNV